MGTWHDWFMSLRRSGVVLIGPSHLPLPPLLPPATWRRSKLGRLKGVGVQEEEDRRLKLKPPGSPLCVSLPPLTNPSIPATRPWHQGSKALAKVHHE